MRTVRRLILAVAATSSLFGLALSFPPVLPALLLVPLPGLLLATRRWIGEYTLWFLLATSTVATMWGTHVAPAFVLPFGVPALAFAASMRRGWRFEAAVLAGIAAWSVGVTLLLLLAFGTPAAVMAAAQEQLVDSIDRALATYASLGVSPNTLAAFAGEREAVVRALLETLPAVLVLTGALMIMLNVALLRRWGDAFHDLDLRRWRSPDPLIWILIAAGFGMFAPIPAVTLVARNVFVVVLGCYFCQGLAIVSYYLDRFRLPRGIRVAGYFLIVVEHVLAALVLALGVFDLWGNFRRLGNGPALHADGD
jgi:uncharacterized protein YybS (DUF2232 family)